VEPKWTIRAYQEGDEEGILQLIQLAFGWSDKKYWDWRYRSNPADTGRIWVADDAGKIVGHGALIPIKMKIGAETVTAFISADTVTHPDYRHQGIFEALDREKCAEVAKEGNFIAYRFPNRFSYQGAMKFGWFEVSRLKRFIKPLNLENILKRYIGNKALRKSCAAGGNLIISLLYRTKKSPEVAGLFIVRISSFDDRVNELWDKVSNDHDIMVVRSKEYLNWKYVEMPGNDFVIFGAEKDGQVCGYMVLKCTRQPRGLLTGDIIDLVAPLNQTDIIHCLISRAIEYFRHEKVDVIIYEMIAGKTYHAILRKCGFISSSLISKNPFCVYSSHPGIPRAYLEDAGHWFIQSGNSTAD
jgi:GNAT superfamily N-acetyltransferase